MQGDDRPNDPRGPRAGLNRRSFIAGALAAGAVVAVPRRAAASGFPSTIPLYRATFENWSKELRFESLLTFAPECPDDVVAVANWAARNGHALRPRGAMHNWSPLSLSPDTTRTTPLVMADTTRYLNRMEMVTTPRPAVRVEAGASLEEVMTFVERSGYGFTATPVVGDITIGGALAINAHGCAVPALGEAALPGQTYGTFSNRVLSLQAVVWDRSTHEYVLRRFGRADPEIGALLTSIGRAFITEVTLAVEPDQHLRCVSYVNIPVTEMCAKPGTGGRSIARFLDTAGRIEMIWYPFTSNPWLKVWSVSPQRPLLSRPVSAPYNYPFVDNIPDVVADLVEEIVTGNPSATPQLGAAEYAVTAAGLVATASADMWGRSKNLLLWLRETTLRVHHTSFVVLSRRDQVQRVCHEFVTAFTAMRDAYRARGSYPANMPIEIRVTGVDRPEDSGLPGAHPPLLSGAAPRSDHPEWTCAVWLSMACLPGTPDMHDFGRAMERWVLSNYTGSYSCVRPEWSKGWAYSNSAAWSDAAVFDELIDSFRIHGAPHDGWDAAVRHLDALDPHHIFSNSLLEQLVV